MKRASGLLIILYSNSSTGGADKVESVHKREIDTEQCC